MKQVRCKGYKTCEYSHRCAHSDIHNILNNCNIPRIMENPVNKDCLCEVTNIRKEKLKIIYEKI